MDLRTSLGITILWPLGLVSMLLGGCGLPTGLLKSRWAMNDARYAEKYRDGAKKTDLPGKIKQAADARFQKESSGKYVSGGANFRQRSNQTFATLQVGGESYATSYLTGHWSLLGMYANEGLMAGGDAGWRLQTPTRLAPFVGVGAIGGVGFEINSEADDGIDNDDDGEIDEWTEVEPVIDGIFAALYPEYGLHFWWNPNVRLTGSAKYWLTTEGASANDWLYGVGLAYFR